MDEEDLVLAAVEMPAGLALELRQLDLQVVQRSSEPGRPAIRKLAEGALQILLAVWRDVPVEHRDIADDRLELAWHVPAIGGIGPIERGGANGEARRPG